MNKIRYNKKVKVSNKKTSSLSRPSHHLITTAQDSLKEYHLSKNRICRERQLSPLSTPQPTLRKTIENAINRQQRMSSSLHEMIPQRKTNLENSRRASVQQSWSRESELMRRVTDRTEDIYPQICPKQFCLKRIRKLFKNDKLLNDTKTKESEKSQNLIDQRELNSVCSPWEVSQQVSFLF